MDSVQDIIKFWKFLMVMLFIWNLYCKVCLPLLIYCFGSQVTSHDYIKAQQTLAGSYLPPELTSTPTEKSILSTQNFALSSTSPQTPQINFKTGPGYENIVSLGCEVLYHYLNNPQKRNPIRFRLGLSETLSQLLLTLVLLFIIIC